VSWALVGVLWSVLGGNIVAPDWYSTLGLDAFTNDEEIEHYVTLLLVSTVMVLFHCCYELLYTREFQYYMPLKDGEPWDVSEHGTPPGHLNWLFGLPCMWFSTPEAYDSLRVWVTLAGKDLVGGTRDERHSRPIRAVHRVFAEELAFYSLQDQSCAADVRKSLLTAKLYDKLNKTFLKNPIPGEFNAQHRPGVAVTGLSTKTCRSGEMRFHEALLDRGEQPAELGVELVFYDSRSGEFHVPQIPKETYAGSMILRHAGSRLAFYDENE